jgi:arabinose-5-phosphate isomerase
MDEIIEKAKEVIRLEGEAVLALEEKIGEEFSRAVNAIAKNKGRVIVTGMGKSGIIGEKIAATFRSVGIAAFFLHPAEGAHGDLGLVGKNDVAIMISKSGGTEEILRLIPILKEIGVTVIAITGNVKSQLAKLSDIVLDSSVREEACPYDFAATTSSTAALALGDALVVSMIHKGAFKPEDFAFLHPGGTVGKRLRTKIEEVMLTGTYVPIISERSSMKETVLEMTSKRGITSVVNGDGTVIGVITDGDLRRLLEKTENIFELKPSQVMSRTPRTIKKDELASAAVRKMEKHGITALIVTDDGERPVGIVHLHDLMREGIF